MTRPTTAERVVETLEAVGVEYVFGYPGGRVIEVFEALSDSPVEVVRPRDEREASVMAEAYGRITGRPAVLAGQGPWIGSLGALGQMEARLGSTPMVVITEASERGDYSTVAPYQQSRGDYGGLDLPSILDGITKEHWFPRTPPETVRSVQLAVKHATAGRPGPTAVVLDGNAVTEPVPEEPIPPLWDDDEQVRNWEARPAAADADRAARALADADRPVVLAGNGVRAAGASDALRAVADAYDALVATSYLGKSTIPETHPRAVGVVGAFGHEGANRVVSEADALLVVGCRLNPMDTNWGAEGFVRPDEQTILHADVDSRNAGWVYPADVGLIGDARRTLRDLAAAAPGAGEARGDSGGGRGDSGAGEGRDDSGTGEGRDDSGDGGADGNGDSGGGRGDSGGSHADSDVDRAGGTGSDWSAHGHGDARARGAAAREDFHAPACESEATPIKPQRVAKAVERAVDADTVVTADSGNNRFWLLHYLQTPAVGTYFGSGGVGAMGWAPPAAVTAALLGYDAVCVAGDGGFAMTMTAVETAVDRGVAPAFVVLNDASLGMVRQMGGVPGVEFPETDFVAVAEAMGADGRRVTDPAELDDAVADARRADRPTVLDVPIDREEAMADQLASSFYESVGGLHE